MPARDAANRHKVLTEDIPGRLAEETHDAWTGEPRNAAYIVSDERLAEIRGLLVEDGYYVLAKPDVTLQQLAAAVYDLLAERDERVV